MKFTYYSFIFVFLICIVTFSCATGVKKEISPAENWAIEEAKAAQATATLVAEFVAHELSLDSEGTKKFVKDYVAEREAAAKRLLEARQTRNRRISMSIYCKDEEGLLRIMKENLSPDQSKKALSILRPDGRLGGIYGFIDSSVSRLIQGKVPKKKIEKAMPILAKYHQQFVALTDKARSEGMSPEDRMDKVIELRVATAKKLVPIIGVDAADFWLDLRTRKGISIKK